MARCRVRWRSMLVLAGALLAACSTPSHDAGRPVPLQTVHETVNRDRPPLCEPGRTFSCVERVGKPVRCICADKDSLREIFDPLSTVR